jgi:hypothetical protein
MWSGKCTTRHHSTCAKIVDVVINNFENQQIAAENEQVDDPDNVFMGPLRQTGYIPAVTWTYKSP